MVSIKLVKSWIEASEKPEDFRKAALAQAEIKSKLGQIEDEYISWDVFQLWLKELRTFGLKNSDWEKIGERSLSLPSFSYVKDLSKIAAGVELTIWMFFHWVLPVQVPMLKIEKYKQNKDGSIECELELLPDLPSASELFHVITGALKSLPVVCFNEQPVTVKVTVFEKKGLYTISTTNPEHLVDRVKQSIANVIPVKALTKEFMTLQKQMMIYYSHSAEGEKKLKIMDQLLAASAKLSSIGEAAASIVHEINNPLATANMILEGVTTSLNSNDVVKAKSLVEKAQAALTRIGKTVKTIQGLLHKEKAVNHMDVTLISIVNDALSLMENKIKQSGVKCEIDVRDTIQLKCDPAQFAHVISNLISNGIDATQSVTHRWVKIEAKEIDSHIEIRVYDNGAGMTEEVRENILKPLFSTKEKFEGTGLGLMIARRIVDAHGGKLELATGVEHTCFIVRIPKLGPKAERVSSDSK